MSLDTQSGVPRRLHSESVATRLVYLTLLEVGPVTQQELRSATGLSQKAASSALVTLINVGEVVERPDPDDGRRRKYVLSESIMPGV